MILGIVTTILFVLTIIKFISNRLKWKKADQLLLKSHKVTGIILIIVAVIHLVTSFKLYETRPLIIYILGFLAIICIIVVAASYFLRKKLGSKWIKIHKIGTMLVIVLVISHIVMVMNSLIVYQKAVKNIELNDIEISNISDGDYDGAYDVGYIYAKVKVTVNSGNITDISILEHRNERGTPAEIIIDKMVEEQRINVDAVSGATNSSKVIEKAVENALLEGGSNEN